LAVKRLSLNEKDGKVEQKKEPNKSRFAVKKGKNEIAPSPNQNLQLNEEKKERNKKRIKIMKQKPNLMSPLKVASFEEKLQD
jgi:hypothetical protein